MIVRTLVTALTALLVASASAAEPTDCPPGNLLAGLRPSGGRPELSRVTDGAVAPEGARFDTSPALVLRARQVLVWDLGREVELRALVVQADHDDSYPITVSRNSVDYEPLVTISPVDGAGLRTRAVRLAGRPVRYLVLAASDGDRRYSVSEIAAYCTVPSPWPPALRVVDAPLDPAASVRRTLWNDVTSSWWELILAVAGGGLLVWHARRPGRWVDRLLAAAGLVAALTYFNFGAFHFSGYIHTWDTFHYYVGAKYFRELGYDGLYECVAVADSREPGLLGRVATRRITNLRTNALESTADILAHPDRCTSRFTAARWAAFRHDVGWFRDRESAGRWDDLSTDHGYNATPVWNVAGSLLANLAPASDRSILLLTLLDPLYFLATAAVLVWAFGWRPTAVALLVFATYFPCRFFWTGGAFLRWDWLFYTAAAVACLRRGRPVLGGLALGYAALLRVFPAVLALGPALALAVLIGRAVAGLRRRTPGSDGEPVPGGWTQALDAALRRDPTRQHLQFLAAAAVAVSLLVPLGAAIGGGLDVYRSFAANTVKHRNTPLTNNMGLGMVLTYRPSEIGRVLVTNGAADPWQPWKDARLTARHKVRPWTALVVLGVIVLLGRAVTRDPTPWLAAALAALAIAFVVELTSYYYAFLIVPALLWSRWRPSGPLLLALCALSQLVGLAPLPGMSTWRDEQYTLISLATLLVFAVLLWRFSLGARTLESSEPSPR
jgi:hypothetical protein